MARASKLTKIGPLEAIEIQGQKDKPTFLVFHGYGADASDLVPLANVIAVPQGTNWIFVNGPLQVPIGMHVYGRGWFPLDLEELERAKREGRQREMEDFTPQGLKKMRENVFELLKIKDIKTSQLILMGFSQGAMLALSLAANLQENPLGLILLSAALIDQKVLNEKLPRRAGLAFFQSHGQFDELLGLVGAQDLEQTLLKAGLKGKLQEFRGGHEIPQEVIAGINRYLKQIIK